MQKNITTQLTEIELLSQQKTEENIAFQQFLKGIDEILIDEKVHQLNQQITAAIDCTACGNCCKTLMINVSDTEANHLAEHLNLNREQFDKNYLEKGSSMMIMNTIPCSFLNNNKCTVYNYRFEGCKEFPALHLPHFTQRLFTTFMHYNRCPIIFNVVEFLKEEVCFTNSNFFIPY